MIGLASLVLWGCVHVDAARARRDSAVAGASLDAEPSTMTTTTISRVEGVVDLSEPPRVVDEPSSSSPAHERGLDPGVLFASTTITSWVPADHAGPTLELELRNGCAMDFEYAFVVSETPAADDERPRRTLAGHTIELQQVAAGQWLHLWDGDRWLASAVTSAERGHVDISPSCDQLELTVELGDRGPASFSIHWELDADESLATAPAGVDARSSLSVDAQDQPELWGPADELDRVELRLANYCAREIGYAFAPDLDTAPDRTATLAGHSERQIEIPAGWWLRYRAFDEDWRGGATTSHDGAVVWITADCVDFGVADGRTVGPDGTRQVE